MLFRSAAVAVSDHIKVGLGSRGKCSERGGGSCRVLVGAVDEEVLHCPFFGRQCGDAEQGEMAVGRQDAQGLAHIGRWKSGLRQLRVEAGDARGLGDVQGDAEAGAPGGGGGCPDGRLGVIGEGVLVIPAEHEGLQHHQAGEAHGGGGEGLAGAAIRCLIPRIQRPIRT